MKKLILASALAVVLTMTAACTKAAAVTPQEPGFNKNYIEEQVRLSTGEIVVCLRFNSGISCNWNGIKRP